MEGLGPARWEIISLPSLPTFTQHNQPWVLFKPIGNEASKRFASKQLYSPFLP